MTDYYDAFFGELSQQAEASVLIDAMYALISGCMEDEFQQEIYQNPDMTLDEINALYQRLTVEYGFDEVYGMKGTEWVLVSHTFQTPMYYISYAVSMVPALELFDLSLTDPQGARETYFDIMRRDSYSQLQTVLRENGLSPIFSDSTISQIAARLDQYT
jgi:oligoendopeptidase F